MGGILFIFWVFYPGKAWNVPLWLCGVGGVSPWLYL